MDLRRNQKDYADNLGIALQDIAECTVWDQNIFLPSLFALESLLNAADRSEFAIFIGSPDDISTSRGKKSTTIRDNVVFELGIFFGRLGRERVVLAMPNSGSTKLPSDLAGVTYVKYDTDRSDNNYQAAVNEIKVRVKPLLMHILSSDKEGKS